MEEKMRIALACYVAALWRIGAPSGQRIYDAHGVVDRALHDIREMMPDTFKNSLTFADTATGLRCRQWWDIAQCMAEMNAAEHIGPSFQEMEVKISERTAHLILREFKLSLEETKPVANAFYAKVRQHESKLQVGFPA